MQLQTCIQVGGHPQNRCPLPPPPSNPTPPPIDHQSIGLVLYVARTMAGPGSRLIEEFEDAAVDGLLAAHRFFSRSKVPFKPFAVGCAKKKIIDRSRHLRAQKRGRGWKRMPLVESSATSQPDSSFEELVESLAGDERHVIELRFQQGMNFEEMGQAMGCEDWKARRIFLRALDRLKIHHGAA